MTIHADGQQQDGTVHDLTTVADLLVAGVQVDLGHRRQRPRSPSAERLVERLGRPADLIRADLDPAWLLCQLGHLPGRRT